MNMFIFILISKSSTETPSILTPLHSITRSKSFIPAHNANVDFDSSINDST